MDGHGDDDMEHPDDIPRRREDDDRLLPRLGSDIAYWWEISGWIKRTAALATIAVGVATCSFNVGMGAEMVRGEWQDVPQRVSSLETDFRMRSDSTILPLQQRVGRLDHQVDTLQDRVAELRSTLEKFEAGQEELYRIAEWNNCLLQVQANQEQVENCGPGG